jgi:quinol monooxygenase YgiN
MINVIASILINEGRLSEFVDIFKANVPAVLEEKGCIEYVPTIDFQTGLPAQALDSAVVTVIEKWDSLDDLKAHLEAPHMLVFRERVKGLVDQVSLKVLEEA